MNYLQHLTARARGTTNTTVTTHPPQPPSGVTDITPRRARNEGGAASASSSVAGMESTAKPSGTASASSLLDERPKRKPKAQTPQPPSTSVASKAGVVVSGGTNKGGKAAEEKRRGDSGDNDGAVVTTSPRRNSLFARTSEIIFGSPPPSPTIAPSSSSQQQLDRVHQGTLLLSSPSLKEVGTALDPHAVQKDSITMTAAAGATSQQRGEKNAIASTHTSSSAFSPAAKSTSSSLQKTPLTAASSLKVSTSSRNSKASQQRKNIFEDDDEDGDTDLFSLKKAATSTASSIALKTTAPRNAAQTKKVSDGNDDDAAEDALIERHNTIVLQNADEEEKQRNATQREGGGGAGPGWLGAFGFRTSVVDPLSPQQPRRVSMIGDPPPPPPPPPLTSSPSENNEKKNRRKLGAPPALLTNKNSSSTASAMEVPTRADSPAAAAISLVGVSGVMSGASASTSPTRSASLVRGVANFFASTARSVAATIFTATPPLSSSSSHPSEGNADDSDDGVTVGSPSQRSTAEYRGSGGGAMPLPPSSGTLLVRDVSRVHQNMFNSDDADEDDDIPITSLKIKKGNTMKINRRIHNNTAGLSTNSANTSAATTPTHSLGNSPSSPSSPSGRGRRGEARTTHPSLASPDNSQKHGDARRGDAANEEHAKASISNAADIFSPDPRHGSGLLLSVAVAEEGKEGPSLKEEGEEEEDGRKPKRKEAKGTDSSQSLGSKAGAQHEKAAGAKSLSRRGVVGVGVKTKRDSSAGGRAEKEAGARTMAEGDEDGKGGKGTRGGPRTEQHLPIAPLTLTPTPSADQSAAAKGKGRGVNLLKTPPPLPAPLPAASSATTAAAPPLPPPPPPHTSPLFDAEAEIQWLKKANDYLFDLLPQDVKEENFDDSTVPNPNPLGLLGNSAADLLLSAGSDEALLLPSSASSSSPQRFTVKVGVDLYKRIFGDLERFTQMLQQDADGGQAAAAVMGLEGCAAASQLVDTLLKLRIKRVHNSLLQPPNLALTIEALKYNYPALGDADRREHDHVQQMPGASAAWPAYRLAHERRRFLHPSIPLAIPMPIVAAMERCQQIDDLTNVLIAPCDEVSFVGVSSFQQRLQQSLAEDILTTRFLSSLVALIRSLVPCSSSGGAADAKAVYQSGDPIFIDSLAAHATTTAANARTTVPTAAAAGVGDAHCRSSFLLSPREGRRSSLLSPPHPSNSAGGEGIGNGTSASSPSLGRGSRLLLTSPEQQGNATNSSTVAAAVAGRGSAALVGGGGGRGSTALGSTLAAGGGGSGGGGGGAALAAALASTHTAHYPSRFPPLSTNGAAQMLWRLLYECLDVLLSHHPNVGLLLHAFRGEKIIGLLCHGLVARYADWGGGDQNRNDGTQGDAAASSGQTPRRQTGKKRVRSVSPHCYSSPSSSHPSPSPQHHISLCSMLLSRIMSGGNTSLSHHMTYQISTFDGAWHCLLPPLCTTNTSSRGGCGGGDEACRQQEMLETIYCLIKEGGDEVRHVLMNDGTQQGAWAARGGGGGGGKGAHNPATTQPNGGGGGISGRGAAEPSQGRRSGSNPSTMVGGKSTQSRRGGGADAADDNDAGFGFGVAQAHHHHHHHHGDPSHHSQPPAAPLLPVDHFSIGIQTAANPTPLLSVAACLLDHTATIRDLADRFGGRYESFHYTVLAAVHNRLVRICNLTGSSEEVELEDTERSCSIAAASPKRSDKKQPTRAAHSSPATPKRRSASSLVPLSSPLRSVVASPVSSPQQQHQQHHQEGRLHRLQQRSVSQATAGGEGEEACLSPLSPTVFQRSTKASIRANADVLLHVAKYVLTAIKADASLLLMWMVAPAAAAMTGSSVAKEGKSLTPKAQGVKSPKAKGSAKKGHGATAADNEDDGQCSSSGCALVPARAPLGTPASELPLYQGLLACFEVAVHCSAQQRGQRGGMLTRRLVEALEGLRELVVGGVAARGADEEDESE